MAEKNIYITKQDQVRLLSLIDDIIMQRSAPTKHLRDLVTELNRATIVTPQDIPNNVITMNSTAHLLDLDTQEELTYTIVYPQDANVDQNKVSVLSPIGTALLGYAVGDEIKWQTPGGIRHLMLKEIIYQPEASGDFHL
ncbi:MAG TPA: nucleoside diphosphate kinase regulator [Candidatus Sumerlaeota bacterium]|nr:MAG: Regulator of nucleoside diphosphate kinase [candidate division BRC1 bacterium ADurb.Bin183]HOE62829.1 nucleoside diphosphate kinase regulator [Candidatus Sumerlaeota bacterium]HRR31020.1 nucleoside diphosphate kinase regulator [Candidatus Sumerlaeia bacterium]HON50179.1 nucleoside diphosphate kinase regulator [Candidatus Sumerlaeota bacterium]HOR63395.1 nucleoside diphosphate kinase regulator [Candidatus Sumerlaeota bacterium]